MTEKPTPEFLTGFLKGIKEFNAREFFECHETLELVWREQTSPEREFTQGVIQTAVAYYHLQRHNQIGAIKLFHRALPRLRKFAPVCLTIDVLSLTEAVDATLSALESGERAIGAELPGPPTIKTTR